MKREAWTKKNVKKYVAIVCLYPNEANILGKRVLLEIDSGPGHNINMIILCPIEKLRDLSHFWSP